MLGPYRSEWPVLPKGAKAMFATGWMLRSMFEFWALFHSGSVLMSMAPYTMLLTGVLVTPVTTWDNVGVKGPCCHWGQGVNCALIASECQNSEALNHINE